ncbi:MAG: TRAP transporter large permease [Pseudomonadota bacterium]
MMALLLAGLVLLLLAVRASVVVVLLTVGVFVHLVWGAGQVSYLVEDMWNTLAKPSILSIPMFILCGQVMSRGHISQHIVRAVSRLTKGIPGGLAITAVLSCAVFSAISGSSPVTLLSVGAVMYPALLANGYPKNFSLGVLTSSGTLGIIIPPSIPLILFGIATQTSIVDLFLAGVGPGILLTVALALYAWFANRHITNDGAAQQLTEVDLGNKSSMPALLIPVVLLGGIYSGLFSPTEAAAVALLYAILVEVGYYREIKLPDLFETGVETARLLGAIFPIIAVAVSINLLMTSEQVPQSLVAWAQSLTQDRIVFLLVLTVLLLIVGCFVDALSAILILAPMLVPVAAAYGIDPIHLGIIMVVNLEIGLLTPPMGLNLMVASTAFKEPIGKVIGSVLPFIAVLLACLIAITFIPAISLFLIK